MNADKNINWELAAKVYAGEADRQEQECFEQWLRYPENQQEWEKIMNELKQVDHALVNETVDVDKAWGKVKSRMTKPKYAVLNIKQSVYVAAVVAIILAVVFFLYPKGIINVDQYLVESVNKDVLKKVELKDGSVVDLNYKARLSYDSQFGNEIREVKLEGEAFFDIIPNKNKPFVILTNGMKIKVLGTSFNVKSTSGSGLNEVNVSSGVVEISSVNDANNKLVVKAGEKAIFNLTQHSFAKEKVLNDNYLAWKTKEIVFKNEELSKALGIIEDAYHISISYPETFNIDEAKLTATFHKHSIDFILDVLDKTYHVDFTLANNN